MPVAPLDRKLSVAPMMNWTDRHFRSFIRIISKHTLLYTEMVTTGAILHGNSDQLLEFSPDEKPLALQVGGSDPLALAECAKIAEASGFDEINLNVGCPSDRVQSGRFGACLMTEPDLVAECIDTMCQATSLPVTVKTRLGVDDHDSYEHLSGFISKVSGQGCNTFILHARKAWLQGLSPKENRDIPPLNYTAVYRIKRDFPDLEIIINGGFINLEQVTTQYQYVDGVMIGRAAYHDPYMLALIDQKIFKQPSAIKSRDEILMDFIEYANGEISRGVPLKNMTRHILGLYQGQPGARVFRRHISENAFNRDAGVEIIHQAMTQRHTVISA